MPESLAPLAVIALMAGLAVFFLWLLSRQPVTRTVVLLPVEGDCPAELLLRQSLAALSRVSCATDLTVVILNLGAEEETLRRLQLLQHDYPHVSFQSADHLEPLLCMDLILAQSQQMMP